MLTILVDAKNSLHRHNYTSNLTDPTGQKVSGVFGLCKELPMLIRQFQPHNLIVVWDKGKPRERSKVFPEYKSNRKTDDKEFLENLGYQIQHAKLIIKNLPVKQISIEGVEADDIIGYFAKVLKGNKVIYSSDNDFLQLVNDQTSVYLSSKKKLVNKGNIDEHLGFNHKYFLLYKALTGDKSDNINGVPKIGDKTAIKLINKEIKKDIDKAILQRNLKLMKIGAYLTPDDITEIKKQYINEKEKKHNLAFVKSKFIDLNFKSLLYNFGVYGYEFKRLSQ